ncbi:hypothetical protein [Paraburkholderia sp. RL17-337-BIB-A]|uniref:hypothetical protein n=1 Tax=Paraburkholderia sp. RL17-337-BIB-A TaxID=3031636 RepID=UPI0038BD76AC
MDVDGGPQTKNVRTLLARLKEHRLARVGPGLIAGVADDDPSGIATLVMGAAAVLILLPA